MQPDTQTHIVFCISALHWRGDLSLVACVNLWSWEQFSSFVCDEMMRSSVYWSVRAVAGWLAELVGGCVRFCSYFLLTLMTGSNADYSLMRETGAEPLFTHAGLTHKIAFKSLHSLSVQSYFIACLRQTAVVATGFTPSSSVCMSSLSSQLPEMGKQCHGISLRSWGGWDKRWPVFRRPLLRLQRMWKQWPAWDLHPDPTFNQKLAGNISRCAPTAVSHSFCSIDFILW